MKTAEKTECPVLYYVRVWVDYLQPALLNADFSVLGPSILGKLIDHKGVISSSGYHYDTVSGRVDRMRKVHADFDKAQRAIISAAKRNYKAVDAALSWEYWQHRSVEINDRQVYLAHGSDIARYLGIAYAVFKNRRYQGLKEIGDFL